MRDRDVRNAIKAALDATNAYDSVYVTGLPEDFGFGASRTRAAVIEPDTSVATPRWDYVPFGPMVVASRCVITILVRDEEPQARDEAAEQLVDVLANTLNGSGLGLMPTGAPLVIPQYSLLAQWRWQKPAAPERRITCTFSYQYLSLHANALDTSN